MWHMKNSRKRIVLKKGFYEAKIATARFYMQRVLPQTGALFSSLMSGAGSVMNFPDEAF